jgi:hypothetical protein
MNPIAMFKELKKLKKEKGMNLCDECVKRICGKVTEDKSAADKFEEFRKDGEKCYTCDAKSTYFIPLDKCMGAIQKVSKK